MEQYPMYARPSLHTQFSEEFNSFTSRNCNVKYYNNKHVDVKLEFDMFCGNYFKPEHNKMSREM